MPMTQPDARRWDVHPIQGTDEVILDLRETTTGGAPFNAELACEIAAHAFEFLGMCGCEHHFLSRCHATELCLRASDPFPLRTVVRGRAAGSFLVRHPKRTLGEVFDGIGVVEFLSDRDTVAVYDPARDAWELWARYEHDRFLGHQAQFCSPAGMLVTERIVGDCVARCREAYDALKRAWANQGVVLVDIGLDLGLIPREHGPASDPEVVIAGVLDHTSWRLWPDGDPGREGSLTLEAIARHVQQFQPCSR